MQKKNEKHIPTFKEWAKNFFNSDSSSIQESESSSFTAHVFSKKIKNFQEFTREKSDTYNEKTREEE